MRDVTSLNVQLPVRSNVYKLFRSLKDSLDRSFVLGPLEVT